MLRVSSRLIRESAGGQKIRTDSRVVLLKGAHYCCMHAVGPNRLCMKGTYVPVFYKQQRYNLLFFFLFVARTKRRFVFVLRVVFYLFAKTIAY